MKNEEFATAHNTKDYENEYYKYEGKKDEEDGEVAVMRSILHSSLFTLNSLTGPRSCLMTYSYSFSE